MQKYQILTRRFCIILCGFVIRSIKKRYIRSKISVKESKLDLTSKLVKEANSSDSFVKKYATWFDKKNRGGLMKPCDDFYLLIRELETVMRKNVEMDSLSANSLLISELKESMLESYMVKHYSLKLFGESSELVSNVLEDIISLFLTIRGYAIARLERNKLHRAGVDSKQSLRQTLKGKTNVTNV